MDARKRALWKRRRKQIIKAMREAEFSEEEIRNELAKLEAKFCAECGIAEGVDSVANLPAVIEREQLSNDEPMEPKSYPDPAPPSALRDRELDNNPLRRCSARRTNGQPCRRWAIVGGTVCATHGGKARQVVQKARIRVMNHADKLMRTELEFAYDETKDPNLRLKAITDSLNRAGLQPITVVEVGPTKPFEEIFDDLAGGSRDESRSRRGYSESIASEPISSFDSADDSVTHPAPANVSAPRDDPEPSCADSGCDPLISHESDGPSSRHRSYGRDERKGPHGPPVIEGQAAMDIAAAFAAAQAERFGLPEGRSTRGY